MFPIIRFYPKYNVFLRKYTLLVAYFWVISLANAYCKGKTLHLLYSYYILEMKKLVENRSYQLQFCVNLNWWFRPNDLFSFLFRSRSCFLFTKYLSFKTFLEGIWSSFSGKKKLKYFAYFLGLLSEKNPVTVI